MALSSLPHDLVVMVLDTMALTYTELKDLTKGFPTGNPHRMDMEYRTETQRLLEECRAYYLEAVKQNGHYLNYVPVKLRDREMCLEAVKSTGYALPDVSAELRDREMCLEAVRRDGLALLYVPAEQQDY